MKLYSVLLTMAMLLALFGSGLPAAAQSSEWTQPVRVSDDKFGWFPDLAVGPDGSVHVVWGGGKPREGQQFPWDLLMYRKLHNGAWSPINDIAAPGADGAVSRSSLITGRDGKLHALVRSSTRIEYFNAQWDQAWSAGSWSPRRLISGGIYTPYYVGLAMDSEGTLHAVWTDNAPEDPKNPRKTCVRCSDVYYRHSRDGGTTWSRPINLAEMPEGSDKPHIKIDRHDRIHVVWDEGRDRNVINPPNVGVYRRSDDGGSTWATSVIFKLPDDTIQQTTLGLTGDGHPLVVYRATKTAGVYYQVSPDGGTTWSAAVALPGVRARDINDTPFDGYSMVTDGGGNVHLIIVGFLSGDTDLSSKPRLLHVFWNGQSWSAPEVVTTDGLYPEWPRAAIGGNTLHLTWFTRNEEDRYAIEGKVSSYRIWYSSRTLDAPASIPLPTFTPEPTMAPTATPQPAPSLTPFPTLGPGPGYPNSALGQPDLDATAVSLLLFSSGPVFILAAIIWTVRRMRIRP